MKDRNNTRSICYIVAMEAEATPLIEEFGLRERVGAFAPLPSRLFEGEGITGCG